MKTPFQPSLVLLTRDGAPLRPASPRVVSPLRCAKKPQKRVDKGDMGRQGGIQREKVKERKEDRGRERQTERGQREEERDRVRETESTKKGESDREREREREIYIYMYKHIAAGCLIEPYFGTLFARNVRKRSAEIIFWSKRAPKKVHCFGLNQAPMNFGFIFVLFFGPLFSGENRVFALLLLPDGPETRGVRRVPVFGG